MIRIPYVYKDEEALVDMRKRLMKMLNGRFSGCIRSPRFHPVHLREGGDGQDPKELVLYIDRD